MSYVSELRELVGHRPLQLPGTGVVIWRNCDSGVEVLLQLRTDHNKWGLIGGGIELYESYPECAIRELYEEAGYRAEEKNLELLNVYAGKDHVTIHPNMDVVVHTVVVYKIKFEHTMLDENKIISKETKSLKWMTTPQVRELLNDAEKNIFHNNIPIFRDIADGKFFR